MTFKDVLQKDIKQVFLNFDEFGEMHDINGQQVLIIIDENELTEREKRIQQNQEGLHNKQLLFFIAAEDFGPLPAPRKILSFDGKKYKVMEAENEDGIYSISLEAVQS